MLSITLSLLALVPFAFAATHDVQVGANGLTFDPPAVSAVAGDQVIFHFHPKAHSVVQSSLAAPCGQKEGGFNSGFFPVAANETMFPTWTLPVNDTTPTWVFCSQAANTPASHCGAGMVFAINCPDGSLEKFQAAAKAVGASLQTASAAATSTSAAAGLYGGYGGGASSAPADSANSVATAAYGGYTIPPAPTASLVTQSITVASSSWVTTYSSYPNSPAPTPAALTGNIIKVTVGGPGKLLYDPSHVTASPRDIIRFEFHTKNHTVTQSSFADPCRKLSVNGAPSGFDSGFMAVADETVTPLPTWDLLINDTAPVWAYCRQTTHCGQGMVFSVNSDESSPRNFAAYQSLAVQMNGTALADTTASTTGAAASPTGNSATSAQIGMSALSAIVAGLVVSFL